MTVHPEVTKFNSNPAESCRRHFIQNHKCEIRGSLKSLGFIPWWPWMSVQIFIPIQISKSKSVVDWLTDWQGVVLESIKSSVNHWFIAVWLWWLDAKHSHLPATSSTNHKGDNKRGHDAADVPWRQHNSSRNGHHVVTQPAVLWLRKCPRLHEKSHESHSCRHVWVGLCVIRAKIPSLSHWKKTCSLPKTVHYTANTLCLINI